VSLTLIAACVEGDPVKQSNYRPLNVRWTLVDLKTSRSSQSTSRTRPRCTGTRGWPRPSSNSDRNGEWLVGPTGETGLAAEDAFVVHGPQEGVAERRSLAGMQ